MLPAAEVRAKLNKERKAEEDEKKNDQDQSRSMTENLFLIDDVLKNHLDIPNEAAGWIKISDELKPNSIMIPPGKYHQYYNQNLKIH